ncbi:MAG: cupin [Chloroflexus sp.]|uniref:cupin domain-containing protein n=1 Tax=Chloroflexus sp. TaxID=1904827 RepID=UPI0021DC2512|nr:cupin domain-containing protein [Chloroflexus sp.]GIV89901.1 MAG: cupin [Chloroflexus sp.]
MSFATVYHLIDQINIPEDGIISRTIYQDATIKAVLFGFAAGQELSEHTAALPAIMHILQGEARITLGEEVVEARPNMWVHMPARLPHSLQARTPVVMLLLLLKGSRA